MQRLFAVTKKQRKFHKFCVRKVFLASKNSHHTQVHSEYCTMPSAIQTMQNPDKLCVFSLKFFFLWGRFIKRGLILRLRHGIYKSREYKKILPNPPRRISYCSRPAQCKPQLCESIHAKFWESLWDDVSLMHGSTEDGGKPFNLSISEFKMLIIYNSLFRPICEEIGKEVCLGVGLVWDNFRLWEYRPKASSTNDLKNL